MNALSRFPRLLGKAQSKILNRHGSFRGTLQHHDRPGTRSACQLFNKLMCQHVSTALSQFVETCRLRSSQFLLRLHSVGDIQHDIWGIDQHGAHLECKLLLNHKRFQDPNYLQYDTASRINDLEFIKLLHALSLKQRKERFCFININFWC